MSFAVAVLLIAQSAAPSAPATVETRRPEPIATVTASARVLRPAVISFDAVDETSPEDQRTGVAMQRSRDAAGTLWVEFS